MGDMLSQAEIDALLNGTSLEEDSQNADMKKKKRRLPIQTMSRKHQKHHC